MEQIDHLRNAVDSTFYRNAESFFNVHSGIGLTYDDITLATRFSEVLPRETTLETTLSDRLALRIPIVSADMDTVTESPMAIAMALNGGLGIIHYNMSDKAQVKEVTRVKNHIHGLIDEPIAVAPDLHIGDVLDMIEKRGFNFHTFPVVDEAGKFIGLLRGRVVKNRYRSKTVAEAMTQRPEVFTIREREIAGDPIRAADRFFDEHMGIHKLIVVDDEDHLRGLFTLTDIERITEETRSSVKAARDGEFRLVCAAAITAVRTNEGKLDRDRIVEHVGNLVSEGADAVAISTAHGHTAGVGESVRLVRSEFPDLTIIAGNVTSGEGVEFLAEAGADAIKVGQGPGSICTTRVVAGVGIPQLTALYVASTVSRKRGVRILADGGIVRSGDIVKALTLADGVVCGSLLAGCREAPGKIMEINGKLYKQYRGMGSLEAMKAGSAARYGHDAQTEKFQKAAAEGIEALKEVSGSVEDILSQLIGGIQSGMGYLGAHTLENLRRNAAYIRISSAGLRESGPHDVIEVKTAQESND